MAVLLFHAQLGLKGGYVGVDIFFVISGYLITTILLRTIDGGTFSLVDFWARRVRRILPALGVTVLVTLVAGYLILMPHEFEELGKSSMAQVLMLANVHFWKSFDYFAGPAEQAPLLHMWSLAVEEQFYLIYPILLCFVRGRYPRVVLAGAWVVALGSLLLSIQGLTTHRAATFYLLPTRAWELLAGCIVALSPGRLSASGRISDWLAWLGLASMGASMFLYDAKLPFPGAAALPPVLGAALVIHATGGPGGSVVGRLLSTPWLVSLGKFSYSIYLVHWPLMAFSRILWGEIPLWMGLLLCALSLVLGALSWKWIEQPFREKTLLPSVGGLFLAAGTFSTLVAGLSLWMVVSKGAASRFKGYDPVLLEDTLWSGAEFLYDLRKTRFDVASAPVVGRQMGTSTNRLDFVVWGDSHGAVLCHLIHQLALDRGLTGRALIAAGIPPLPNITRPNVLQPQAATRAIKADFIQFLSNQPPRNLILISRWSAFLDAQPDAQGRSGVVGIEDESTSEGVGGEAGRLERNQAIIRRNLQVLADLCVRHGITLWVFKQVPETGGAETATEWLRCHVGKQKVPTNRRRSLAAHHAQQSLVDAILDDHGHGIWKTVDPAPYLFDADGYTVNFRGGRACYRDGNHLTRWGTAVLRVPMDQWLGEMVRQP